MTPGGPWQVEGVEEETRESARAAARRSGMSVGEWLDTVISDQARGDSAETSPRAPPGHGDIGDVKGRLDQVGRELDQLSHLDAGAPYLRDDELPRAFGDVISRLGQRLDQLMTPGRRADQEVGVRDGATPPGPPPTADRSKALEQALMEIAERQRALQAGAEPAAVRAPRAETPPPAASPDLSNLKQQLRQVNSRIEALRPCAINEAVETLRDDLAQIGLMLKEAMPRRSIEALEAEVRGLSERLALTGRSADAAIAGVERGLTEVRDALRALTPAESLVGVEETVRALAGKIDRLAARAEDPISMQQLESAVVGLRGIADHVASDGALAKLSDEVSVLAAKVDRIASSANSGADLLSALEQRLSSMAQALEAPPRAEAGAPSDLDALVKSLSDRLSELGPARNDQTTLGQLEERITSLVERLDTSNARFSHLDTIERGLVELMADLDRQRHAEIERTAAAAPPEVTSLRQDVQQTKSSLESVQGALEQLVERLATIESDMRRPPPAVPPAERPADTGTMPAPAPLRPAAPAIPVPASSPAPEHRPIDPNLPPDHPLEPGAMRARSSSSPGDRIAASEAALGAVNPPTAPDPGSKSNFIAAARRAAQAANSEGGRTGDKPAPTANKPERVEAAGGWGNHIRSVLVAVSVILIVLGSVHAVMSLFRPTDAPANGSRTPEIQTAPNSDEPASPLPTPSPDGNAPGRQTTNNPAGEALSPPVTVPATLQAQAAAPLPGSPSGAAERDITGSIPSAVTAMPSMTALDARPPASAHPISVDKLPAAIGGALRMAAAKGEPAAEYEIGQRFAEGRGVPENLAEAAEWYDRAAKQDLPIAQFRLGGFYEKGFGVKKDLDAARRLYTAAAEAGNAKAMHNLAVLYAEGIDGKPDYQNAAKWFRKAADYGLTDSQYNLGILYGRGIGMPTNLPEAYKWFTLAARDGDKESAAKREEVGSRMDPQSLAAAKAAAEAFTPMEQPEAATQAPAPPGGWDVAAVAPVTAKPRAPKPERPPQGR